MIWGLLSICNGVPLCWKLEFCFWNENCVLLSHYLKRNMATWGWDIRLTDDRNEKKKYVLSETVHVLWNKEFINVMAWNHYIHYKFWLHWTGKHSFTKWIFPYAIIFTLHISITLALFTYMAVFHYLILLYTWLQILYSS